jgi:hypothetical protein
VPAAQIVKHAVAPQVYGSQAFCAAVGHAAPEPLQRALSVPVPLVHEAALQVVVLSNRFAGQLTLTPSHFSAGSQIPADARHCAPALPAGKTHPFAGSQLSSVQGLPSLQVGAAPPTHLPPAHRSDVVQALPSSQALVLLATMQPVEVSHESSVQGFLSSQVMVVPVHLPATQWSLLVQALLSLQAFALSLVNTQPLAGAHESSVQGFLSSQANAAPPTHALFAQVSLVVQALLSLHGAVLATLEHPDEELQESSVQGLLSLQFVGPLETQLPPLQWSPVVQALPSLQVFELDTVNTHPVAGAHVSLVHGLLSLQLSAGPPVQVPEPLH